MKAVFLDYATLGSSSLRAIKDIVDLDVFDYTASEETIERSKEADIIITNKVVFDESTISALPKLKLICVAATGVNNIDLKACQKAKIAVYNVKGYSTFSVAQIAFSSLFYKLSNIAFFDDYVKSKSYCKSKIFTNMEVEFGEIASKTIGIIGFGDIGRSMAQIALSFGMKVCYHSTSGANKQDGFEMLALPELLQKSDIVCVHCPLNEKTLNLINSQNLIKMKKNAILMNFARGKIVNEKDVVSALNDDKLALYITDVFDKEPMDEGSFLFNVHDKNKLVMTPHIAWGSIEARDRLVASIAKNIRAFIDGENANRVV